MALLEELQQKIAQLEENINSRPAFFGRRFTDALVSPNYQSGNSGWKIDEHGNVEFNDGTFRGTITATAGSIGGWEINGDTLESADQNIILDPDGSITITSDDATPHIIKLDASDGSIVYLEGVVARFALADGAISFFAPSSGSDGGSVTSIAAASLSFILGDGTLNSLFFSDNGDTTAQLEPGANNKVSLGTSSLKWSDVQSVLINGADIGFFNGWKFREYPMKAEDVSKPTKWFRKHANKGIQLLDENDKMIAVFHKNGTLYCNDIKPLTQLK